MKLAHILLAGHARRGDASEPPAGERHELGNFSVSLTVRDIDASKAFYEKLGFVQILGDTAQGWAIMRTAAPISACSRARSSATR